MENIQKVDEHTISVDKTTTNNYDYGFLKKQRVSIQEQLDKYVGERTRELEEIDALIEAADQLGVVEKK